jgi:hypothetical protein
MAEPLKIKSSENQPGPGDELRKKAKRWDKRNEEYRQNEDGTRSTHRMGYATEDNSAIAYPTVFPKNRAGTKSHNPKDWMELDHKAAADTAYARGEIYKFKSEQNAKKWAEGEYKKN